MLSHLKLRNVGPSIDADITFSKRLNILTGDNGLGKSFLLDIAWWCMTSRWWFLSMGPGKKFLEKS